MQRKHNEQLVPLAKTLRKEMTREERHLWYDYLRFYPVRFSRQKVLGKYIADFYSAEAKIVIELDGSNTMKQVKYKEMRNAQLFWKNTVLPLFEFQIMKSAEISAAFASISMLR